MRQIEIAAAMGIALTLLTSCGGAVSDAEQSASTVTETQITETQITETTTAEATDVQTAELTAPAATETSAAQETQPAASAATETVTQAPDTTALPETEPPSEQKSYADYYAEYVQRGSQNLAIGDNVIRCKPVYYMLADLNQDGIKELLISYDPSEDPTYFYLMEIQQCFAIENGAVSEKKPSAMHHVIEQYLAADGNGLIDVLYRANGGGYSFGRDLPLTWDYQELGQLNYDEDYDAMKRDAQPYCGAEPDWHSCDDLSVLKEQMPE